MKLCYTGRIWLDLVAICTSTAALLALALALISTVAVLAAAQVHSYSRLSSTAHAVQPPQRSHSAQHFSGVISDSICGAKHDRRNNQSAAGCTRFCLARGAHYALVSGDTVYSVHGYEGTLDHYAGQRLTLTGTLEGNTITLSSVPGE
ncbi:MAG TPA: hypothetical protein VFA89_03080 [Terriglobales bacterium]|nr:hypothetical protein [Terriglobales bacterium]